MDNVCITSKAVLGSAKGNYHLFLNTFLNRIFTFFVFLQEDVLRDEAKIDDDEELVELLVMYSVALTVVSFVYFTELKSHLNTLYQYILT